MQRSRAKPPKSRIFWRMVAGFRRQNLTTDETEYLIFPDTFRNA